MMSANTVITHIPKQATKSLKLQTFGGDKKKLVVSTNWLPLFGFTKEAFTKEELIGKNKGLRISLVGPSEEGAKKVYTRTYKSRRNNPHETLLDIRKQSLIQEAFPENCTKVQVVFKYGEILILPVSNKKLEAIEKFKKADDKYSTFLALSSGVDGVSLTRNGFSISTLLEYRPNEKRDKNDLSETGALNALSNFGVGTLINEDIMDLDLEKLCELTQKSNHTFAHFSPQCDDFSNLKAKSLKEASMEDGSTTIDMVYDVLKIIEAFMFPTLLIENVTGFFENSDAGRILQARLKRFGYEVHYDQYDARDYGGHTSRVRGFLFASLLGTEFKKPSKVERNCTAIWEEFIEPKIASGQLRNVSHSVSLQKGIKSKRVRLITRDSLYSSTFAKSQSRCAKDSVYIYDEQKGEYYFPTTGLMAELMGIEMDFNAVGDTIASEIVGQSLCVNTHRSILNSVKEHIATSAMQLTGKLF
jgi:DNA (cytosine-5)-methyltransferase 1